jgi:UDP-2-acetamido-3-amino-2,3-dideoxy-glucuronate N-acetyltransferase
MSNLKLKELSTYDNAAEWQRSKNPRLFCLELLGLRPCSAGSDWLVDQLEERFKAVLVCVHPSSEIEYGAIVGEGTKIWQFCHIFDGAQVGSNCVLGQGCSVASNAVVGDGCRIQNGVHLFDGVTLGDEVFCGPNVTFTNIRTPRAHVSRRNEWEVTNIRRRASLGGGCVIRCGITVGEYALVGAGAVVTKSMPPHALVYGNPAKHCGWVDKEGNVVERWDYDQGGAS